MKTAWVIVLLAIAGVVIFWNQIQQGVANLTGIAQYASNAGFTGADLLTAVAVAYAESGGNPNAYYPETAAGAPLGGGSYGLWQIYLTAHPEFQGQNLYDPQTNANAAYSIYEAAGYSFSPWSTFKGGQYQNFIAQATADVGGITA